MPCPEDGNPPPKSELFKPFRHTISNPSSFTVQTLQHTIHKPPILIRRTPISCPYPMTSSRPPTAILVPLLVQSDRRSHNSTSMPPSNLQHSRHSPPSILRNPTRQPPPPQRTHTSIKTTPSLSPLRTSSTPAISSNSSAPSSQKETDLQIRASDLQLPPRSRVLHRRRTPSSSPTSLALLPICVRVPPSSPSSQSPETAPSHISLWIHRNLVAIYIPPP
ncbi:hypothetical protein J0A71_04g10000 [Encephalitozoon cuniculi]|nr:hypothetical protein J0A71_04g10000 [Encephalitozoon cuniculi]